MVRGPWRPSTSTVTRFARGAQTLKRTVSPPFITLAPRSSAHAACTVTDDSAQRKTGGRSRNRAHA